MPALNLVDEIQVKLTRPKDDLSYLWEWIGVQLEHVGRAYGYTFQREGTKILLGLWVFELTSQGVKFGEVFDNRKDLVNHVTNVVTEDLRNRRDLTR